MNRTTYSICVFGLGEAGAIIGAELAAAGNTVTGFDPKPVATPPGVDRCPEPVAAAAEAEIVVALTAAEDAPTALEQAFDQIPETALYADFSTAPADLKRRLAARCAMRRIRFADVAIMSIVPGKGLRAPTLVSGDGAPAFVEIFRHFGMPTEPVSPNPGDAAARKLLRSVMMKGLAAVVIEAMQAAQSAGCSEWLWQNMAAELSAADETMLSRLVRGTRQHGLRRLHEMEAAAEMLRTLGVEPLMTAATTANLRRLLQNWPDPRGGPGREERQFPAWWHLLDSKST